MSLAIRPYMIMKEKIIVLFVEGASEVGFFKNLANEIKKQNRSTSKIIVKNMNGIGNFKGKVYSTLHNSIIPKYPDSQIKVFLCYDTDVFSTKENPPVDWSKIDNQLETELKIKPFHIKAKYCIEDWFLLDINNICKSIKLPCCSNLKGTNGVEKMKKLFRQANKIYQKGSKTNIFVGNLDYLLLLKKLNRELVDLVNTI